uniref:Uncharacterized protein n=1 Tax=Ascaris lumbricoides TaxID=6252 RepID=A0A9J2PIC5_ASCLU
MNIICSFEGSSPNLYWHVSNILKYLIMRTSKMQSTVGLITRKMLVQVLIDPINNFVSILRKPIDIALHSCFCVQQHLTVLI